MKSIRARFLKELEQQPSIGCYEGGYKGECVAFADAIRGQRLTRYAISKNMNNLITDPEDKACVKANRKDFLNQWHRLSNPGAEEPKIEGENLDEVSPDIKDVVSTEKNKKICE